MYQSRYPSDLSGVGALPSWLTKIAGAIVRGTTVTVPTPTGQVIVDLGNPASVAAAKAALLNAAKGTKLGTNVGTQPTLMPAAPAYGDAPSNLLPMLALAAVGLIVLPKLLRRR